MTKAEKEARQRSKRTGEPLEAALAAVRAERAQRAELARLDLCAPGTPHRWQPWDCGCHIWQSCQRCHANHMCENCGMTK